MAATAAASGFADEKAADIIKAASTDMGELESVHLNADITSEGSTVGMDLSLNTDGNCEGTINVGGGIGRRPQRRRFLVVQG